MVLVTRVLERRVETNRSFLRVSQGRTLSISKQSGALGLTVAYSTTYTKHPAIHASAGTIFVSFVSNLPSNNMETAHAETSAAGAKRTGLRLTPVARQLLKG